MNKTSFFAICISLLLLSSTSGFAKSKDARNLVYDVPHTDAELKFDEEQDEVYEAVQKGLIKPFSELYQEIEQSLNGRLIKVELEEDDDEWIYELKLIYDNNVIKAEYNATTLELLELKGRNLMSVIKR